jgi:hypothetical protein
VILFHPPLLKIGFKRGLGMAVWGCPEKTDTEDEAKSLRKGVQMSGNSSR